MNDVRYKCIIAYDGHSYFGWQTTQTGPSIQSTIQQALFQITREQVKVEAASRTDRGVHAQGQVIHFSLSKTRDRLQTQLNGVLPPTIRVLSVELVAPDFHATLSAQSKEYHYFLCLGAVQLPMHQLYSWHVPSPLHLQNMERAKTALLGTQDFSSFANEREPNSLVSCSQIDLIPLEPISHKGARLQIKLRANRFLYKMARNLVGTLVYIGCGKLPWDSIPRILAAKDRTQAAITAPAHGLYLSKVFYD